VCATPDGRPCKPNPEMTEYLSEKLKILRETGKIEQTLR